MFYRSEFSKIYEYADHFIIPLHWYEDSAVVIKNGVEEFYHYYIAKRGKVIFVIRCYYKTPPEIDLTLKLIHIPADPDNQFEAVDINIDEIIANKGDLDLFYHCHYRSKV